MKTIKPMRVGLLCNTFEHDHQQYFVVSLLVGFPFDSPRSLLLEPNLWRLVGAELGKNVILDECMSKQRGELLVTGRCFTPGGVPRPASSVRVQLGAIDKTLYVVGDRRWGVLGMSDPEPFTEMQVDWSHAFGGEGYAANPLGKGVKPVRVEGQESHPLPNVEDPKHLVKAPGDRPTPAGFGALDPTWPARFSKVGTYDKAWLDELYPGLARDLDYSFYNAAPPDQQIEGYFQGDEAFVIENMHPEKPRIEGALPRVSTRCFITQKTDEGEVFREAVTRLDTVHLFPHRERGIAVFRGVLKIREDDAADVLHVLAACEAMGDPKPLEHYRAVLAQRLDKKKRHLAALRDKDLMPSVEPGAAPPRAEPFGDVETLLAREDLVRKNLERRKARYMEELEAKLREQGIDPETVLPAREPESHEVPSLDDLSEHVERAQSKALALRAEADATRAEAERRARADCEKQGVDYDALVRQAQKDAGGPPKLSARRELERLRDTAQMARNGGVAWPELEAQLAVPGLEEQLLKVEEQMLMTYRRLAHYLPAAATLEVDQARSLREEVIAGRAEGQSFAGRDLTGVDLSHLDLRGIDLERAMLEGALLTGSDLGDANLAGAVLARADLDGVNLRGAKLAGANLGGAKLCDVKAEGVDLTGAVLVKANLSGADLRDACLTKADLSEAILHGADCSGVFAERLLILKGDWSGVTMASAKLQKGVFLEANVSDVDFSGADLSAAAFLDARGDGAVFRGAKLDKLRLLTGSSFAGADFRDASLQGANLRGTRLVRSDFTAANLRGADLSECDLEGAVFDRAIAVDAMFVRANLTGASMFAVDLMQSILQKANLRGANLESANLFRADAARMVGDDKTSLAGANVKRVRFVAVRSAMGAPPPNPNPGSPNEPG